MSIPLVSIWRDLECVNPGGRLADLEFTSSSVGAALDNTEVTVFLVKADDLATLNLLTIATVLRVQDQYGTVSEFFISNVKKSRTKKEATITTKPVEILLNRVMVRALNATRASTVVNEPVGLSASDWIALFVIPSLAFYGMPWWAAGICSIADTFPLSFVDQTCMWLIKQNLLQYRAESLIARRNGAVGYYLDLVVPALAQMPVAAVGDNVLGLDIELDDLAQATVIVPGGQTFSGNDEPERGQWYAPIRVASLAGTVATLEDPSDVAMTILAEDRQPFVSTDNPEILGMNWRLGCITPPVAWGASICWRTVYIAATKTAWAAFSNGIRSLAVESRALGTLLTSSLTKPTDLYYDAAADKMWVADVGGARVTPYTAIASGGTVGTPITVGAAPRRLVWLPSLSVLLVTHGNVPPVTAANAIEQISTGSGTVVHTSPAMTAPAHLAVVSATQIYVGSDSSDAVYRYNATANTVGVTIATGLTANSQNAANNGYASLAYCPTPQQVWACQHRSSTGGFCAITIIDATTDTIVGYIKTTGIHGQIVDCTVINGLFYGVTDDGLLVCYNPATRVLLWARRHASWPLTNGTPPTNDPATWVLHHLDQWTGLDCWAIGAYTGTLAWMDAQTGGAMIARAITSASAAAPSVTLANSSFPLSQYDEVVFCRDDGDPLFEIPNASAIAAYGVKQRQVIQANLDGGSNRALNGDMVFFDASRKTARFLNPTLPDATSELRWDGYTDPAVQSFVGAVNGNQATVATPTYAPQGYTFKSMGANRVFQPGDLLIGGTDFLVLAKATADGAGNVTLYGVASNNTGVLNGDPITVYRPFPGTLLGVQPTWVALPCMADASGGVRSSLSLDCLLPFIPGEMTNLYWGIEGYLFGLNVPANAWELTVRSLDGAQKLLDVFPNPASDPGFVALQPMMFDNAVQLPAGFAGGHVRLDIKLSAVAAGPHPSTLFVQRLWLQVGNADRGAPSDGAPRMFDLGQQNAALRGDPPFSYTVQVIDDDPSNPFVLGAKVLLRDPANGIYNATPRIVTITKPQPRTADEKVQPVLTLDNRSPNLISWLIKTTSNQS